MAKIHGHAVYDGLELNADPSRTANVQHCLTVWSGAVPSIAEIQAGLAYSNDLPEISLQSLRSSMASLGNTLLMSTDLPAYSYPSTQSRTADSIVQSIPARNLPAQLPIANGNATFFMLLCVRTDQTVSIYNADATVVYAITGTVTDDETTELVMSDTDLTTNTLVLFDNLHFNFPLSWSPDDYSFMPNPDLTSVVMVVEVLGRSDSTYAAINELTFCDRFGNAVPYTTSSSDVWDVSTSHVPASWNSSPYGRSALNDSNHAVPTDGCRVNAAGGATTTVTRFSVTFSSMADVELIDYISIHIGELGVSKSQPNTVNVYALVGNAALDKPTMLDKLQHSALRRVATWIRPTLQYRGWVNMSFIPAEEVAQPQLSITNQLIVEVETPLTGHGSHTYIGELQFLDADGLPIAYTTTSTDVYSTAPGDATRGGIHKYWNSSPNYGRENLNDGLTAWSGSNMTLIAYGSSIGGSKVRFLVTLAEGRTDAKSIKAYIYTIHRPKAIRVYAIYGEYDKISMLVSANAANMILVAQSLDVDVTGPGTEGYINFEVLPALEPIQFVVQVDKQSGFAYQDLYEMRALSQSGANLYYELEPTEALDVATGVIPATWSNRTALSDKNVYKGPLQLSGSVVRFLVKVYATPADPFAGIAILTRDTNQPVAISAYQVTGAYSNAMLANTAGLTLFDTELVDTEANAWTMLGIASVPTDGVGPKPSFTPQMVLELEGDTASASHVYLAELEFFDADNNLISYYTTSVDAYDETTGGLPTYWNDSNYGRNGLNNGGKAYSFGNVALCMYGAVNNKQCRMLITLNNGAQAANIDNVKISIYGNYRPRHARIYAIEGAYDKPTMLNAKTSPLLRLVREYNNTLGAPAGDQTLTMTIPA